MALVRVTGQKSVGIGFSTLIALAIFVLFLVYITAKGRLSNYLAVLFGPVTVSGGTVSGAAGGASGAAGAVSGAANLAGSAASLAKSLNLPTLASPVGYGGGAAPDLLVAGQGGAFATSDFTLSSGTGGLY